MGRFILFLLIVGLIVWLYFRIRAKLKLLSPLGTITLVTGAVKAGKSTLAVHLALKSYRKTLLRYKIAKLFRKDCVKPLLYSNIPLNCEYAPLTKDILLRRVRVVPKSVVLVDEASLLADSQLIKDHKVNAQLMLFFKLFGHSSHGGTMVVDTQSVSDLHYAIKRCLNSYIYIKRTRSLPFFLVMDCLEQRYSDDGTVQSNQTDDVDANLRHVLLTKRAWKMFDTYAYSVMTDDLPVADHVCDNKGGSLKARNIVSFRDWKKYISEDDN